MTYPVYQDRFQASITPIEDGVYIFSFSIKDVIDERELVCGNTEKDILSLKERKLINNSELLDYNTVIREGLDADLNQVKYDDDKNKLEDVCLANQERVNLHLLHEEKKQAMGINKHLSQKWVSLQMKCFDYCATQRSSLDYINGLDITNLIGTENEWIYHFAQSINEIKRNTKENLAKEFNKSSRSSVITAEAEKASENIERKIPKNPMSIADNILKRMVLNHETKILARIQNMEDMIDHVLKIINR